MKRTIKTLVAAGVVGSTAVLAGAYFGVVNVGADDPHFPAVHAFLTMARDRSIEVRSRDIEVPNLDDQALIRAGAGNYNSMCIGCHLAPGVAETELSQSLYPAPPNLAKIGVDGNPSAAFWVIKHGIKATGMPAWGKSMGDEYIWGMVAFIDQLPTMDAKQYQALVASSGGHQHGGGETQMHNHEGQHGDNKPGHHDNSGGGDDHHGSGDAGEPGHHDAAATDSEGGSAPKAGHHSDMSGDDHHAGDEASSNGGDHHAEQAPNASPKTHTHADGKETCMKAKYLALLAALSVTSAVQAADALTIDVHRDANCGCCKKWISHLEANGFKVVDHVESNMSAVKQSLGVAPRLASCHTAVIDGKFVEGHVPAAQVIELTKRDDLVGIAVPGMPAGSPGMEVDGVQHAYQVIGLTKTGSDQVVAEYPAQ